MFKNVVVVVLSVTAGDFFVARENLRFIYTYIYINRMG